MCYLTDGRDGVAFGKLSKRHSDGLFVTTIQDGQAHEETHSTVALDDNKADPKISTALVSPAVSLWNHR